MHFIEIAQVTSGKVVQANHFLVELEQGFEQVATYEASDACDKPGVLVGLQLLLQVFVDAHKRKSLPSMGSKYFKS